VLFYQSQHLRDMNHIDLLSHKTTDDRKVQTV